MKLARRSFLVNLRAELGSEGAGESDIASQADRSLINQGLIAATSFSGTGSDPALADRSRDKIAMELELEIVDLGMTVAIFG